jgi:hypothetical protein
MVTMTKDTNVLLPGYTTTKHAAEVIGVTPMALRRWLCRHKEIERKFVGNVCLVDLAYIKSVYNRHM